MIGEKTSRDFVELTLNMTVSDAQAKLGTRYGIVYDANGRPVTIILIDDLTRFVATQSLAEVVGQLPPGVMTTVLAEMETFVQSSAFSAFAIGARGAIVYEGDQIIGILTEKTITRYLQGEFEPISEIRGVPSDVRLAGDITEKPLIIYCDQFNHRNELAYYNRHKPPQCQVETPQPHPIRKKR